MSTREGKGGKRTGTAFAAAVLFIVYCSSFLMIAAVV